MELYRNIKKLRTRMNLSQEELAEKLGYKSKTTISKIESGKVDIPQSKIAAFAKALNTTPGQLMGIDQPKHSIVDLFAGVPQKPNWSSMQPNGWLAVPISGKAACGEPIEDPSAWEETFYIPPDLARGHTANDFLVIRAKGESMEPKILDNNILVFLREYSREITEPCAVYMEGQGYTVKKVRYDDHGNISLIANNADAYEPHTYTPAEAEDMGLAVHGYLVRMERRDF